MTQLPYDSRMRTLLHCSHKELAYLLKREPLSDMRLSSPVAPCKICVLAQAHQRHGVNARSLLNTQKAIATPPPWMSMVQLDDSCVCTIILYTEA